MEEFLFSYTQIYEIIMLIVSINIIYNKLLILRPITECFCYFFYIYFERK